MEMGENRKRRGEEILPVFEGNDDDGRRRALISLLFSSLSLPLPSLYLIWSRQGLAAQGGAPA